MINKTLFIQDNNSFQQTIVGKLQITLIISIFVFIGYIFGSISSHPNRIEKLIYSDKVILAKYNEEFSEQRLIKLLNKLKVKHIDIVVAQTKIETANYSSAVFLENNNLFGMRQSQQRVTTSTGTNLNHATYDTWQESVIDYAIYQSTFLKNKTRDEYLAYLRANYAEDKNYINLIQKIAKKQDLD